MVALFRITPVTFVEMFIGVVTSVWAASFVVGVVNPHFDTSQYNNIFMVVAGSGVLAAAFSQRLAKHTDSNGTKPGGDQSP